MENWVKKDEKKVIVYDIGNGWFMDVEILQPGDDVNERMYDAWIYHKDYSVKDHMVGFFADKIIDGTNRILNLLNSLMIEDYKRLYWNLHIQEGKPEDYM